MQLRIAALALCLSAGLAQATERDIGGLAATCHSCHGVNGVSVGPNMPSIAGQGESYLKRVMLEQKHDKRYSSIMGRLLRTYSDEEVARLASHFAAQRWENATVKSEMALVNRGRQVSRQSCQNCHGASGEKVEDGAPRLAGQWPDHLFWATMKYVDRTFPGKPPHEKMAERCAELSVEDVRAVSHFLGTRKVR